MRFSRESLHKSILGFCRVERAKRSFALTSALSISHAIGAARAAATSMALLVSCIAGADDNPVARMKWLSGCWASVNGEAGSGEQWMPPAGRSMFGMSRTVRDGATVAFEFMRIAEEESGKVVFVAAPSGQQPATFELLSLSDNEVIFENPDHDFPQRVLYRLMPGNLLTGRIEGTVNGAARGIDFPMKRTECGSGGSGRPD